MRRRWSVVAFVLCMAVMVAWAPGSVAAGHGLVVGSQHTTDTDFEGASTLRNLTVSGTGTSANVTFVDPGFTEGFEDGDLNEYSGNTSAFSITSTNALSGTYSLNTSAGSTNSIIANTSTSVSQGTSFTYTDYLPAGSHVAGLAFGLQNSQGWEGNAGYYVTTSNRDDSMSIWRIHTDGSYNRLETTGVAIPADEQLEVSVDWTTAGEITATVTNSTGAELGSVSTTDTTFTSGHMGWFGYETHYIDDMKKGPGGSIASAEYVSANHSVSDAEQAAINITDAANVSITLTAVYHDGASWVEGNNTTVSSTGNHTLSLPDVASDSWRINASVEVTGDDPAFALADDAILFTPSAPQASNLQPPDGTKLTQSDVDFSVDVNDTDFPLAQGDSVDATLHVDGSAVGTKTITSNGTVTITETLSEGGDHTYHWELSDSYGESTTTATNTVTVPSTLSIRNASNASELVQDNVTVSVEFVTDDGQIITRETSNGTISLDGLDVDQEFVVRASADGWITRRTVITSIFEQSSVYIINSSSTTTNSITFNLEDETGEYPPSESRLFVKAPADPDGDGNTTYVTVAAGPFDASEKFETTLIYDKQYRLIVENSRTGNQRVLGSYVPLGDAVEDLPIGQVQFQNQYRQSTAFGATLDREDGQNVVRFQYQDAQAATTSFEYEIYKINETGEHLVVNNTSMSMDGTSLTVSEPVPTNNSTSLTYKINWHANRDGEPDVGGTEKVGALERITDRWPIDPTVLSLIAWVAAIAFTGFVVIIDPPGAAMVFAACLSLFTALGAMSVNPIALGLMGAVAVAFNVGRVT